jgi:phosphopantothenoylcysteine decarboxylase/phosphopantothenate--cysteine ligase
MAPALTGRRVAVGVGGGIAAYKACDLVRELRRRGAEVRVAMTPSAQQFVTALTFQSLSGHPVLVDSFDPGQEALFGHLHLSRWAELYVLAPATADLIARVRAGMANDAVTTSLLAFRGPVLIAPAMNVAMYENPITQENLKALCADARYRVVGPASGLLADGDVGAGRLEEVQEIARAVEQLLAGGRPLAGRTALITAGPTREPIDPVRFISNPSTGKMGLSLAREARARGAAVTVVLGPVGPLLEAEREGLEVVEVHTAAEMAAAVMARVGGADFFLAAAAVSDYRPEAVAPQKIKKTDASETLRLVRTPDVLAEASRAVRQSGRRTVLLGFAAETEQVVEHARQKLRAKDLDFIVANDVSRPGAGFGVDTNQVTVISRDGGTTEAQGTKREVAARIWDLLQAYAGVPSGSSGSSSRP